MRVKMLLLSASTPTQAGGPMLPTLRGQLFFRGKDQEFSVPIEVKLSEVGAGDSEEED